MTTRKHSSGTTASSALVSALCLGLLLIPLTACSPQGTPASAAQRASADPRSDGAKNVRLVGYNDLQGRQSLEVKTKSDAANGNWAYVGHSPNNRTDPEEPILNPITKQKEWNGTSILEISDPANPKLVWHIPNQVSGVNSRSVHVVYDYQFNSSPAGRDYLIRSWDTGKEMKFQIFDITSRGTEPSQIALVSEITGTPPNSCGQGCGGKFIERAHKGFWSQESGAFLFRLRGAGFPHDAAAHLGPQGPQDPEICGQGLAAGPERRRGWF